MQITYTITKYDHDTAQITVQYESGELPPSELLLDLPVDDTGVVVDPTAIRLLVESAAPEHVFRRVAAVIVHKADFTRKAVVEALVGERRTFVRETPANPGPVMMNNGGVMSLGHLNEV